MLGSKPAIVNDPLEEQLNDPLWIGLYAAFPSLSDPRRLSSQAV